MRKALHERRALRNLLAHARLDRVDLEQAQAWLNEHFDLPAPTDIAIGWYVEAVHDALEKEREAETAFRPVIQALKEVSAGPQSDLDEEVQKFLWTGILLLEGWLGHFHRLHEMLARQLAERRKQTALDAKQVKSEVDHAAITDEIIKRFPNILKALAE